MSEARIGRIVAAALHESLAAHLPFRVEYYEHWLQPPRLRAGTVGIASFLAVLSFLRQEGEVYHAIVEGAGRHAADWMFAEVPGVTRFRWRWSPRAGRLRAALRLAHRLAAESSSGSRSRVRLRRGEGRLQVDNSPFCMVRSHVSVPLCGFYAAAASRFCEHLGIEASVAHETCRGMGAAACTVAVLADGRPLVPGTIVAEPGRDSGRRLLDRR